MSLTLNGTTGVDGLTNLGIVTATGTDTARSLANRFADVVNVKDFGAVGDYYLPNGNVNPTPTDNATAFQNAVNYAATLLTPSTEIDYPVVKGAVYIPSGAYYIASGSSITLKKGVCIFGESRSSSQIIHGGGNVPCITTVDYTPVPPTNPLLNTNVQIQIEKLFILGSGASTTYGIQLYNSYRDSDIREVTINNCNVNLYLENSFTAFIDRCDFQFSITDQIEIVDATAITIFNCRMDNAGRHGVYLNGITTNSVHAMFDNNQIQRCQGAGIYAVDIDSFYVNNGYFEGNNRLDSNWSDIHWVKSIRNRGSNGGISNCYATAYSGGSNNRFVTADIPGILTIINCRNYDDNTTPDPAYEYGVYLGTSILKFISIGNTFEGTTDKIYRASTDTNIYDDSNVNCYIPNSKFGLREVLGGIELKLTSPSNGKSSIIFGDSSSILNEAQSGIYYDPSTKTFSFNGYDNVERIKIKEQGQFQFARLATPPTAYLSGGDVYYDTTSSKLRVYNGSSWVNLY